MSARIRTNHFSKCDCISCHFSQWRNFFQTQPSHDSVSRSMLRQSTQHCTQCLVSRESQTSNRWQQACDPTSSQFDAFEILSSLLQSSTTASICPRAGTHMPTSVNCVSTVTNSACRSDKIAIHAKAIDGDRKKGALGNADNCPCATSEDPRPPAWSTTPTLLWQR